MNLAKQKNLQEKSVNPLDVKTIHIKNSKYEKKIIR